MGYSLWLAFLGTGFSFLGTTAGSAMVYLFRDDMDARVHRVFLGFASGVMIAASFWSLLLPALDMAGDGLSALIPVAGGFAAGGIFLYLLDQLMPPLHAGADCPEGKPCSLGRSTLLVLAVTLHNIPEGMAVGLSFALAAAGDSTVTMAGSIALAIGMALQNFPEGAAISLPLRREGMSRHKAFLYGAASGAVEPVAGIIGVVLAFTVVHVMPFMLSFAAGAMIYVVIDELVPEAYNEHSNAGTLAALAGFLLMMVLDVTLG